MLSEEDLHRMLDMVSKGIPYLRACEACGIDKALAREWEQRAHAGEPNYVELMQSVRKRRALGLSKLVDEIVLAAQSDWKAAAWLLERRDNNLFGPRERRKLEHTGPKGGAIDIKINMGATVVGADDE